MPQLWKTGRPATTTPTTGNQPSNPASNKGFLICPPLVLGGDGPSNGCFPSSPPSSPSSPTSHQHPPKYDQLLNELRRAQERRGRLQSGQADTVPTSNNVQSASVHLKNPLPNELRRTLRSPEPSSGTYVNQYNSSGGLGPRFDPAFAPKSPRLPNKTVTKKVRFLEDGTGNLHTSVFGGSAESVGSLLDSHQDLNQSSGTDEIDSLISSLISYSDISERQLMAERPSPNGTAPKTEHNVDLRELRIPVSAMAAKSIESDGQAETAESHHPRSGVLDNFLDIFRCAEVVDQRQTVVHLEPDDPNSVDSGSVLSELDFEETSSTITDIDSNKTFSLNSPDNQIDHRIDDWSQVSDLLERSLQEIRQMEEDTNKTLPEKPTVKESKREPLYELIGWKRNPPPVQLDLRGSKPFPLPSASSSSSSSAHQKESPQKESPPPPAPAPPPPVVQADVWIPRQDWVPPAAQAASTPPIKQSDKVWIRRPTLPLATNSHNNNNNHNSHPVVRKVQSIEDNPIYGRLWETSSSPNNSSRSSSCSAEAEEKPSPEADLTAIRSMARKARLEHWRLTGMSSTSPADEESYQSTSSEQAGSTASSSCSPAYLSSLPLFNHRVKNGIQLTWPPPPLPHSPCSSSATATPVTPTLPPMPTVEPSTQSIHNGHSPKCFGHQRIFQWPVPALKLAKSPTVQRNGSTSTERREIKPWRPAKPVNLEDAQDWYWTEEFPLAAGLEPGTGNMSAWFHGAISRWEAERRLTNQPTGAFLARLTERLWGYAISVRNPSGSVSHFLVDAGEKRSHKKYTLLGSTDSPHKSLRELIQHYGKHPLTPDGSEKLLFPCPQESSVAFPQTSTATNGSTSSRLIKST